MAKEPANVPTPMASQSLPRSRGACCKDLSSYGRSRWNWYTSIVPMRNPVAQ